MQGGGDPGGVEGLRGEEEVHSSQAGSHHLAGSLERAAGQENVGMLVHCICTYMYIYTSTYYALCICMQMCTCVWTHA